MKIIIYTRVSTDQQAESGLGLAAQKKICEEYAKKMGQEISAFYTDEGISGAATIEDRPGLMSAINSLKKGDILLVAKRDRLARDQGVIVFIEMAVRKKHAHIRSASGEGTEGDFNDPSSFMLRGITDLFSQFERMLIKDRTKKALQAKKERNELVGRVPFGYRLCSDGVHLELDEREQHVLSQMRDLRKKGYTIRKIAMEMNERGAFNRGDSPWNHASVHRILKMAA